MENFHGYIYKITNLVNSKIYIGGTSRTVEERFEEHCKSTDNSYLHKSMRKYGIDNFKVETIAEAYSIEELGKLEIDMIEKYKSFAPYGKGYNLTRGGDAFLNRSVSHEYCGYSDFMVGRKVCLCDVVSGKIIETYNSINNAEKENGKRVGIRTDGRMSSSMGECFIYYDDIKGKTDEEIKEYIHSLSSHLLYCLDIDGNIVKIYKNVNQASEELHTSGGNIAGVCNGNRRLAAGFQWCYQKDLKQHINKPCRDIILRGIPVIQYGMNGIKIKEWNSLTEASDKCGIIVSDICSSCNKTKITAGGYQWRYSEENIDSLLPTNFSRKVRCIETDKIFSHANEAAKIMNISIYMVKKSCLGFYIHSDYHFVYEDMTEEECQKYEENKERSYIQPSLYETLDPKLIENICNDYNPENGIIEMVEKYDVLFSTVRLILETNGIKCYSKIDFEYRNFKHDYFDKIDSPIKAYWLGFIFGKSSFERKYAINFTSSGKYIGNIIKLANQLCLDRDLSNAHGNYSLRISSLQMSNTLKNYGINDKETVKFPVLENKELYKDFMRGLFESSGGATSSKRKGKVDNLSCAIYANYNICENFIEFMEKYLNIKLKATRNHNSYRVRVSSVYNIDKFLTYMYYDNCYCYCLKEIQSSIKPYSEAKHVKMNILDVIS